MPFMEILLLESNTLNGTIYRFVSVDCITLPSLTSCRQERTLHTPFHDSENLTRNFRSLSRRQQSFVNENSFAARVQLSAGHPRDRTRPFLGKEYFEIQIHKCKEEFLLKKFFIFRTCRSAVKSAESKKIRDESF